MTKAFIASALCAALAACSALQDHSAQDYEKSTPLDNPDGSLTTIAGPDTAIVDLKETLKFPEGDVERAHTVLKYDRPAVEGGLCLFHTEYANDLGMVVKGPQVEQPCDGRRAAQFRVGGIGAGFVSHLHRVNYKGTPVTLLEMSKEDVPEYVRVVY